MIPRLGIFPSRQTMRSSLAFTYTSAALDAMPGRGRFSHPPSELPFANLNSFKFRVHLRTTHQVSSLPRPDLQDTSLINQGCSIQLLNSISLHQIFRLALKSIACQRTPSPCYSRCSDFSDLPSSPTFSHLLPTTPTCNNMHHHPSYPDLRPLLYPSCLCLHQRLSVGNEGPSAGNTKAQDTEITEGVEVSIHASPSVITKVGTLPLGSMGLDCPRALRNALHSACFWNRFQTLVGAFTRIHPIWI